MICFSLLLLLTFVYCCEHFLIHTFTLLQLAYTLNFQSTDFKNKNKNIAYINSRNNVIHGKSLSLGLHSFSLYYADCPFSFVD